MVSRNLQLATVLNIKGRVDQSVEQELNKLTAANERAARQFLQNNFRQQTATSRLAQAVSGSTRSLTSYSTELRHIQQRLEALGRERQSLVDLGEATDDIDEAMGRYGERLTRVQGELEEIGSTPFGRRQLDQFRELEMGARATQETFNRLSSDQSEFSRQFAHQAGQVKALGTQLDFAKRTLGEFRAEAGRLKSAGGSTNALQEGIARNEEEIKGATRALASLRAEAVRLKSAGGSTNALQEGIARNEEEIKGATRALASLRAEAVRLKSAGGSTNALQEGIARNEEEIKGATRALASLRAEAVRLKSAGGNTNALQEGIARNEEEIKGATRALASLRAEAVRLKSAGGSTNALQEGMERYEEEIEGATRALASLKDQSPGAALVRPLRQADEELTSINRRLSRITDETKQAARAAERWQQRLQRVDRAAGRIRNVGFGLAGAGAGAVAATLFGGERASVHREASLQAGFSLRDYFVNTQALRTLGARDQIDLQRELGKEGRARIVDPSEETVFAIQRISEDQGKGYEQVQQELLSSLSGPNAVKDILLLVRRASKDLQPFFAEALIGGEGGERLLEVVTRTVSDIEKAFAKADPALAGSLATSTETLADMRVEMENLQFRGQLLQSAFATGLIPLMRDFAASITPAVMGIQEFAENNPRAAQTIAGLTLTIAGLGTAMTVIGLLAPGLIRTIHGIRAATIALTLAMRANPLFAIAGLAAVLVGGLLINRFLNATEYKPAERSLSPSTGDIITTGLEGSEGGGSRRDPRTGILLEGIPFQPITPTGNPCPELAELEKQTKIQEGIERNTQPMEEEALPRALLFARPTPVTEPGIERVSENVGREVVSVFTGQTSPTDYVPGFQTGGPVNNVTNQALEQGGRAASFDLPGLGSDDAVGRAVQDVLQPVDDYVKGLPANFDRALDTAADGIVRSLSGFYSGLFGGGGGAEVTINQTINGLGPEVADAVGTATKNALTQVDEPNN